MATTGTLLSIVELGGYPNFANLYQAKGFNVERVDSMRKAVKRLKTIQPRIIVAEFNYQTDFRDRSSNLETLMATVSKLPNTRVIVFYEPEQHSKLEKLMAHFRIFDALSFPVDEQALSSSIDRAILE